MTIISVGRLDRLRRSLPHLAQILAEPIVTLERIAQIKHDGELLEPLPTIARRVARQTRGLADDPRVHAAQRSGQRARTPR